MTKYEHRNTLSILNDVKSEQLSIEDLQQVVARGDEVSPEYLASVEEALKVLLGPEEIARRGVERGMKQDTDNERKA